MTAAHALLGELDEALVTGARALEIARRLGDLTVRILTTTYLEQAHYCRGEYERVVELATDNLVAMPADRVYEHFGGNTPISVTDRYWLVMSLAELGRFAEAAQYAAEALRLVEPTHHAFTVGLAHLTAGCASPPQGRLGEGALTARAWDRGATGRGTSSSPFPTWSPPPPGSSRKSATRARR